jgi:D-alanyl-D-alanine carboxypeptidase (penicillin-binding protein 5/6)
MVSGSRVRLGWWQWGRVLVLGGAFVAAAVVPAVAAPSVTARAAIIVDADTGETLWEHNADQALPPASTTKVMTAILAIESGRLDDYVTVSPEASGMAPSKLGLRPGERMALGDLLYAVLLNSANDASTVVAEGLAGSEPGFARHMNAKAREIGARRSNFVNPHGLTAPGHVSTARDLTRIFRYALRLPQFRDILETPRIKVPVKSKRIASVNLRSHNRLLTGWTHRVIGKTGYTRPAGRCFVASASAGGREVVIAFLGSRDLWGDARRLFAHALGGPSDPTPPVVMAKAPKGKRATRKRGVQVVEGDDDGASRRERTRVASIDRKASLRAAPARADKAGGRFAVRLGPYSTRKAAESARNRLAKGGYRARIVGQALMIGDFSARGAADKTARNLRVKGYRPTIVAAR